MMISCVMPTYARRAFIKAAIKCYQEQTYPDRELIILDDGEDKVRDLIPADPTIRYYELPIKYNTGDKRNMVNSMAKGEIIAHFDDDDWSSPTRLEHQVSLLDQDHTLTGYKTTLFWDVIDKRAYYFKSRIPNCVYGCTITYYKSYWESNHFASTRTGSDFKFVMDTIDKVACSPETTYVVSRIHATNISEKPHFPVDPAVIPVEFWENEKYRLENL